MFESLVSGLLRQQLEQYIKNLDLDQLAISVWAGEVVLHNLEFREDALDAMGLPIYIKSGYIGKLTLQMPWKNLTSKPSICQIEDVFIVIAPKANTAYDEEKELQAATELKLSKLQLLDADQDKANKDALEVTLKSKLIDNFQLQVRRVHLRYEDETSSPGRKFCMGLHIKEVSAKSTNAQWEVEFVVETTVHKLCKLDSMGIYFNVLKPDANLYMVARELDFVDFTGQNPGSLVYLLSPMSTEMRVIRCKADYPEPRTGIAMSVDQLSLVVNRDQYLATLDLLQYFSYDKEFSRCCAVASYLWAGILCICVRVCA
jgi:vacuolar protein sorting-associated protein 13A/C